MIGLAARARRQVAGEHGDEGRRRRPFRNQPAEKVRNAIRDEERVGGGAGAEKVADHRVTDEPGDTGDHRQTTDDAGRACDLTPLAH